VPEAPLPTNAPSAFPGPGAEIVDAIGRTGRFLSPHSGTGQNLQFAAESLDNLSQGRYLHINLFFEFRQARLLHAERLGDFLLAFAGKAPNLA
jgi:hypothetical protein